MSKLGTFVALGVRGSGMIENCSINLGEFYVKMGKTNQNLEVHKRLFLGVNIEMKIESDSKLWYYSFAEDENRIKAISSPKCAADALDKKRADYIINHIRIMRLFIHKRGWYEFNNIKWDFRETFSNAHYEFFLKYLCDEDREKCNNITYGDMYCSKVNAFAYPDEKWGDFINVNVAIKYFSYFMLLALLEPLKYNVPKHIIKNALRIGLRTWLGCEALDFEMDPRGILPENIEKDIQNIIPFILVFISGHEFSHHLLGHCRKNNLRSIIMWGNNEKYIQKIYNASQKEEFAADIGALEIPKYPDSVYENVFECSLIWFLIIDLAEYAMNVINPGFYEGYQTHPSAMERFNHIVKTARHTKHFSEQSYEKIIEWSTELKKFIRDDISENYGEIYDDELYGSLYLDLPNTEWRGKELIDRVDY